MVRVKMSRFVQEYEGRVWFAKELSSSKVTAELLVELVCFKYVGNIFAY